MKPVKTIVVTGAAGHLGHAVAQWWSRPGVNLVLIDRAEQALAARVGEAAGRGASVTAITVDLAAATDLTAAVGLLPPTLWQGGLSLVLLHGVAGRRRGITPRLGDLDRSDWQGVLDVNLTSIVFAIQTFLPFMKMTGGGRIVLVSSAAGLSASPTAALSYSVTKAAVAALPRLLATELGASQVLINAVAPGKIENPQWPDDAASIERYADSVPLGRIASTEEVAALIGFLSSDANTYLTGQTILQDGGRLSAPPGAARP
jgi:NAD(P)-dependent dehydrogenase (short-subunit alcohol dehydrogenase family)